MKEVPLEMHLLSIFVDYTMGTMSTPSPKDEWQDEISSGPYIRTLAHIVAHIVEDGLGSTAWSTRNLSIARCWHTWSDIARSKTFGTQIGYSTVLQTLTKGL